jgi:hypothetical protein
MKQFSVLLLLSFLIVGLASAQKQEYKVGAIGFYNFENLFDTLDAPDIWDEEFTPAGSKLWNTERYQEKLDNLAKVVAELGTDVTPDGVSILGVAEIENRSVLEDFVAHPLVKSRNYQIIHYDSPDFRGIDVALLYNPKYFTVSESRAVPLKIYDKEGEPKKTRDILLVSGIYDGEPMHFLVNHWPSRRGGEAATQEYRNAGALVCKQICDSLTQENPYAKVIIMGDLNDDPISPSVKKILNAKPQKDQVRKRGIYNPMTELFKKGFGTLAYRDAWSLFDQMLLSQGLISKRAEGYSFFKVRVHNPPYLLQKSGRFKGYPFRSFGGSNYLGGYSDHFPVYVFLVKPVE